MSSSTSRSLLIALLSACGSTAPRPVPPPPAAPATAVVPEPPAPPAEPSPPPYLARRTDVVDVIDGVRVADPYRWLEDGSSDEVKAWEAIQGKRYHDAIDALPGRARVAARLEHLMRYDDETLPTPCLDGRRAFYYEKRADQDKWSLWLRDAPGKPGRSILDPNKWPAAQSLDVATFSADCRYLVYGAATGGDENPILRVLDVTTMKDLPDTTAGWRANGVSWRRDAAGFYYSAHPRPGDVPAGDEYYYNRAYYHRLGTTGDRDVIVLEDTKVKEHYNSAGVTEDGRWLVLDRSSFYETEIYLQDLRSKRPPVPVVTGFGAEYSADVVAGRLVIVTNWNAPHRRVMVADPRQPDREHWKELIPEGPDPIAAVQAIGGRLYVSYTHDAASRVAVFSVAGRPQGEIPLPAIGSAGLSGYFSKPEVRVTFQSFAYPPTVYRYDAGKRTIALLKKSPIDFDPSGMEVEQVWYTSPDGSRGPVFLVHAKDAPRDGSVPYVLYGYGGFDVRMTPSFSSMEAVWVEAGGGVAVAVLRGGGEYGKAWHEAGMRERKQHVFDDFIAAAELLVAGGHTRPERLAIWGGSNGGLLVGAAMTQRPDLFRAVLCEVPLLDMMRYQKFGIASEWVEEYGSSDEPAMAPALLAYSPYHHVTRGTDYPAVLVTASDRDARVDAMHARKFVAALQWADPDQGDDEPIYLDVQRDSGHGGGVGTSVVIEQTASKCAFLMAQVGLLPPPAKP